MSGSGNLISGEDHSRFFEQVPQAEAKKAHPHDLKIRADSDATREFSLNRHRPPKWSGQAVDRGRVIHTRFAKTPPHQASIDFGSDSGPCPHSLANLVATRRAPILVQPKKSRQSGLNAKPVI